MKLMTKGLLLCVGLALSIALPVAASELHFKEGTYGGKPLFLKDGVYEAKHFYVTVAVTIARGKIVDIKILYHGNGGKKYEYMVEPLIGDMVRKQTTEVDVVTGATWSSQNLSQAVLKALLDSAGKTK
jgi:fumarate reductase flavoprotein subunit